MSGDRMGSTGRGWIPGIGLCECDTKSLGFANCKDVGDQLSDGSFHGIPCNVKLNKGCYNHSDATRTLSTETDDPYKRIGNDMYSQI